MAIQMRRGQLAQYDKSKMLPGEWGISIDNDSDNQKAFISFAPGVSKEVLFTDSFAQIQGMFEDALEEAEAWAHGNSFTVDHYDSGDGETTEFTLKYVPSEILGVYVDGVGTDDYTVTDNVITFDTAPPAGSNNIYVNYVVDTSTDNANYYRNRASNFASIASESATTATNKAADAERYKERAKDSASTATSKANSATAAANSAASSASTASTKASNAASSASTASTKASNAANSATAAANSATTASQKATAASNSATAASNSATAASNSANAASQSAGRASTSATNAARSENNATTAANAASSSASAALSSATNALNSSRDSEAWAAGTRNGTPVSSSDPQYHNNAKYYTELLIQTGIVATGDGTVTLSLATLQ